MYSHPRTVAQQRRLFGRRRPSFPLLFWAAYLLLLLALVAFAVRGFFLSA